MWLCKLTVLEAQTTTTEGSMITDACQVCSDFNPEGLVLFHKVLTLVLLNSDMP